MAAKPSTPAENALQKIQDQVTCGICLEPYKQPKLLQCFHVYCEGCLQPLVRAGRQIPCPNCRKVTPVPVGGVQGLQGAFLVNTLLEIQDTLRDTSLSDHCFKHPEKEADFYCEQCDQLMCSHCLLPAHRNHQYNLVSESFAKQNKVIVDSLKPVEEQIAVLERAVESVGTRCTAVVEQKTTVVAEIRTAMVHLRQALEARETELVSIAERTAQQKLNVLEAQRNGFELQLGQLKHCQDFLKKHQSTCSQGAILRTTSPVVKQAKDLMDSFKPETLVLVETADLKFSCISLPQLMKTCQQFGMVYCFQTCPGNYSENTDVVAVRRQEEYRLQIPVEDYPILSNNTLLPHLTAPAKIIENLKQPQGIAVKEGGEVMVVENKCVSVISVGGEKRSFAAQNQLNTMKLTGLAIDDSGNILVVDSGNHCILQLSSSGNHLRTVGSKGNGLLFFENPRGITVHHRTHRVYVADGGNHRIQVLNFDLSYSNIFGSQGSNNGELSSPCAISTDRQGNVYVADSDNHRIQVFTENGVYLRQFGKTGDGEGELKTPVSIAIDSQNLVYVGDVWSSNVWVFTTDGKFITLFGSYGNGPVQFTLPNGIAVDRKGTLYISDSSNGHIQIFTRNRIIHSHSCL